jgi:PAS domain S-box-containing protein
MDRLLLGGRIKQDSQLVASDPFDDPGTDGRPSEVPPPHPLAAYLNAFLILLATTLICGVLNERFGLTNVALLYLLPVFMSAIFWGLGPSLFVSITATLAFDFFFVRPPFNFIPRDPRDLVVLGVFVVVAVVTGTMATRLRKELEKSRIAGLYNRSLIETSLDPLIIVSPEGKITDLNAAAERITGVAKEELTGQDFSMYFTDPEKARQVYELVLEKGVAVDYELSIKHVDGSVTPVIYNASAFKDEDGKTVGIFAAARDMTGLKQAEVRLRESGEQLRALSAHIQSIREEERTGLARDIHDDLGQALTGLKLDLSRLSRKLPKEQGLFFEEIKAMEGLIDDTIKVVRRISSELRPGVLDDLGLIAAAEWQADEFQKRTGIECSFAQDIDDSRLLPNLATALFRILQEALTNVARHSKATRAWVSIEERAGSVRLTVGDNGVGITTKEALHPRNSLGLLGMKERARLFGGNVTIEGYEGEGTTLAAVIPLNSDRPSPGMEAS